MKMNKKLVISSLAICMGAGLVGSVSGTVAWYQYSTRAAVNMAGVTAGVSKTLEIGIGGDGHETAEGDESPETATVYKTNLSLADIDAYLGSEENEYSKGDALAPITPVVENEAKSFGKNDPIDLSSFVGNPIAGVTDTSKWIKAEQTDFIVLPLYIRAKEVDKTGEHFVARDIGMSDITLVNKITSNKIDLSSAIRVHVSCDQGTDDTSDDKNLLIAKNDESINTYGALDLDGDGFADNELVGGHHYEFQYSSAGAIPQLVYGKNGYTQASYKLNGALPGGDLLVDDEYRKTDNSSTNNEVAYKGGYTLGQTKADSSTGIKVQVVIWLEGWAALNAAKNDVRVWDAKSYIGSQFNLGITFCNKMAA